MPEEAPIRHREILSGLRDTGLKKGDIVLAHSSLSSFGNVEGGPDTVIDALLETVGDDGTLIMPSHTDVEESNIAGYDPQSTPVRKNIGTIPDTFWRRPDVLRGSHPPRHPWAGKGKHAEALIGLSEVLPTYAQHCEDGTLHALPRMGGYVLLLGCMHVSSTSVHSAEVAAVSQVEGVSKRWAEFLDDFNEVDEPLQKTGGMRIGRIGHAVVRLMLSANLFKVVKQLYMDKYRGTDFDMIDYARPPDASPPE